MLLAIVLFLLRRPAAMSNPWFWAEDGAVFFTDQQVHGFSPLDPYAGQVWVLQRLVAGTATFADPITSARAYYVIAGILTVLFLSVVLAQRCAPLLGSLPWRLFAFALLVLLPGAEEVQGTLANLHVWAAIAAVICLTARPPANSWSKAAELAFIAVVSLSGFVAVVLLPAAAWSLWKYRTTYARLRLAVVALGLVVAVIVWLETGRAVSPSGSVTEKVLLAAQSVPTRVAGTLAAGEDFSWSRSLLVLPLLVLAVVVASAVMDRGGPSLAWLSGGVLWLVLGAVSLPLLDAQLVLSMPFAVGRYFGLLLAMSLLTLVRRASGIAPDPHKVVQNLLRVASVIVVALAAVGILNDYRLMAHEPLTPGDSASFEACLDSGAEDCRITVFPTGWTPIGS